MTLGSEEQPLWSPGPERVDKSEMTRFRRFAEKRTGKRFAGYADLHEWSMTESAAFWELLAEFSGVVFNRPAHTIKGSDRMPGTEWFAGARLNYAENLLRYRDDHTAIIAVNEAGGHERYSYSQLYQTVAKCARALEGLGIGPGDRVAGYTVNGPEAVVALLGCAAVGAVWSSCSPDFGPAAAVDRLGQIRPRLLLASDEYRYGGKRIDCLETVRHIERSVGAIERVVVIPYGSDLSRELDPGWLEWRAFLGVGGAGEIDFASLPFDHPLYILFSSGTTGVPKCIVHGAGGTLLQHRKEHLLHTGLGRDDVLFYFTTCGWMMWNWLASALAGGGTIVLYDGSPAYPDLNALWRMAAQTGVTAFGASASFIEACMRSGLSPRTVADLSRVRTVLSTGSPLSAEGFRWVYEHVDSDLLLASISGGTDIVSCFVLGNPNLPVFAGQIQCVGLGLDVAAVDSSGKAIVGEKGELVCRRPFPCMPIYFWNDPDGQKYKEAYFTDYPGWWRHGDYMAITERGGIVIYGRSDATLNIRGVRIGTAEIYRPLESLPWILNSLAIEQRAGRDVEIVLFVILKEGIELTSECESEIRSVIRRQASPRHVPGHIHAVADIPVTRNGKKAELAVKKVVEGDRIPNLNALANPGCLDAFRQFAATGASKPISDG